ncbi:RraA family protein [Candidatus Rariloculus sp.]|uniref:RraA family protein n=1 Tax=Candidatus Rariloculus sp. TaxID=3101265 RepID=UPI003D0C5339
MAPDERASQLSRLGLLDSCAVSDALDSLGLPPAVTGLTPLSAPKRIAGPVVTVKLGPGAPAGGSARHLGTAAIEAANAGDIIVLEHSSGVECAGWGGVLSVGAQVAGVEGIIIDGPARDIDEARELGFPVYARSATARTARGRVYEQDFDCPVTIGDVVVAPGDIALADASGVVFIPREHLAEVVRRAERIAERERLMVKALRNGDPITEVVGRDYEEMLDDF